MTDEKEKNAHWKDRWSEGSIGFHKPDVHEMLLTHFDKLKKDGKLEKIFFPLCGKSVDMKWLADQGITVVGIDLTPAASIQFFTENNLEYTVVPAPSLGSDCQLFESKDGKIKLYCGDIFNYNESFEGKFDAIWDRASLVALDRSDVLSYVRLLKNILQPGGKILLEALEYDVAIMKGLNRKFVIPPPHPMFEDELKTLFEPECSMIKIDGEDRKLADKDIKTGIYLITKH